MKGWNDEAELIGRCKTELPYNHKSFEILFERYKDLVYTLCYRLAGSHSEAEDLVQEVFTKVFQNLKYFEERSKFSSWLYRISHNHCLDHIQSRKREYARLAEISVENKRQSQIGDRTEFSETLQEALNRMSADDRGILIMKYVIGLDLKEISAALEITTAAVKMRLMRARIQFREAYEVAELMGESSPPQDYTKI